MIKSNDNIKEGLESIIGDSFKMGGMQPGPSIMDYLDMELVIPKKDWREVLDETARIYQTRSVNKPKIILYCSPKNIGRIHELIASKIGITAVESEIVLDGQIIVQNATSDMRKALDEIAAENSKSRPILSDTVESLVLYTCQCDGYEVEEIPKKRSRRSKFDRLTGAPAPQRVQKKISSNFRRPKKKRRKR